MKQEFDPALNTVVVQYRITDKALTLLGKAHSTSSAFEVKRGIYQLIPSGGELGTDDEIRPLLDELEKAGMVTDVPDAWHPTFKVTKFGGESADLHHNPPALSLPLLLFNTAEAAVTARKDAEKLVDQALEDSGMEVEYVAIGASDVEDTLRLICKARFLDDDERERPALVTLVEECLGLPDDYFDENPDEARLTCRDLDGIWNLWVCGPHLEG